MSSLRKLPLLELRRKGYELGRLHHISRLLATKGLEFVNMKKEVKKVEQPMRTRLDSLQFNYGLLERELWGPNPRC